MSDRDKRSLLTICSAVATLTKRWANQEIASEVRY
jgi:hypothetical protein